MNILIPTDFSTNAWNAIQYAMRFFETSRCNFFLLHVNTEEEWHHANNSLPQHSGMNLQIAPKHTKNLLQDLVKRIHNEFPKSENHKFYTISDSNTITNSIREQVVLNSINFIVMGTKGAASLNELAIGTNTGNVITKVKCTTLVVPENARYSKLKKIAFPTDFSIFYNHQTLQPILDILEINNATINMLHVNKCCSNLNEDQQRNKEYLSDYFTNYKHSFNFLKDNHIENAVQEFVDKKEIHLITMLAKNLNYFQRILFHPTVNEISYYKDVPFLVLH